MQITLREPGKCTYSFYCHDHGSRRGSSVVVKSRIAWLCLSACHAGFYHQHDLIIWCKCHIPFCQSARIRDQNTAEGRSLHDLRPDCRLLHTCLPSGAGPETGIPIADRSLVACIDRDRH